MEKTCGIYFRGDDIYVSTMSQTNIGFWIGTEPRFKLKSTDSAEALGSTVMSALDASRQNIPTPPRLRSVNDDLLKFVGFKTLSSFERGTIQFVITWTENGVNILPTRQGTRGSHDLLPNESVDCKPDPEEVGQVLQKLVSERQSS